MLRNLLNKVGTLADYLHICYDYVLQFNIHRFLDETGCILVVWLKRKIVEPYIHDLTIYALLNEIRIIGVKILQFIEATVESIENSCVWRIGWIW